MKTAAPLISVCIPLFETESFLNQCLMSVLLQDFDDFEVVIVNDNSRGKDDKGHKAKKIVSIAQKEAAKKRKAFGLNSVPVKYIEHHENRGLVEVRRTLVYEARGEYITMVDSDDVMEQGALKAFAAKLAGQDIIHGTSRAGYFDSDGNFTPAKQNRYGAIFYGLIEGHDIFHRWLVKQEFTANTWGKLIRRDLFVKAYENIPYTECNMGEDLLLFFYISLYAKTYLGISDKVYRYRIDAGMTSKRKIDSLQRWKMVCSASSVFAILSTWIKEDSDSEKLLEEEVDRLRKLTTYYLENNLRQLKEAVVSELQDEARQMLCDYWGQEFVEKVSGALRGGD